MKWVEAMSLTTIISRVIAKFILHHIVLIFGVPHTIITDNGT
jgi:hypothetical protein